jgi:2-polyprenyl-6-hydroxyphenyl methylase/3-demethylubiquinone-9 3-methyltransferase
MPVDNEIYNAAGDAWWDEHQPLYTLRTFMNPARMQYFTSVFSAQGLDPAGKVVIDIGCGGGLFAEDVARLGASVIGIDPAPGAIDAARRHAAGAGLAIDYRVGPGEHLPADDACADIVYCVDVLEHVADVDAVVGEAARVLRPGGLFLFDTINRTMISKIVMIKLCQDWPLTAWMPPGLHDWDQFIKPAELRAVLARHHLREEGLTGLKPGIAPPALIPLMYQVKKGKISYAEFGRRSAMVLSKDLRASYIGHATKATTPAT